MQKINLDDTIAAIATPVGVGGIGIVRLSGRDALAIADKIFVSSSGKKPSTFKTYTVHYGWIINGSPSHPACPAGRQVTKSQVKIPQEIIDEVILTVMRSPRSYTKEDVVEINCHGGIVALRAVLDLVLENGARLAEPGEFTKRAFLNGRIDLAQAEAVLDIIKAKTDAALNLGMRQLKGALSGEVNKIRGDLLEILSLLEANIDFPEDNVASVNLGDIQDKLNKIKEKLNSILKGAKEGRIFREGINAVICGRPNVGKSSLLNALLKEERSIVTAIPGTTRDTIEEIIDIKGIPVRIVDTAGILEPRDLIEKKAVERAHQHITGADLVLLLFDGSKKLTSHDDSLIRKLRKKNVIAIINKIDLKQAIQKEKIAGLFPAVITLSAKKRKNINLLEDAIAGLVYAGKLLYESVMVSNLRHIEIIRSAQKLVASSLNSADNKAPVEFIAEDIRGSLGYLDDLLGRRFSEDLLDKIFNDFCIGK